MALTERQIKEQRKVAREAQERIENIQEIAEALHYWNAQMLFSQNCMLLPGDICICGKGGLEGSRGAFIPMDPEAIADLVDSGALSRIFDPDDLNTPDFSDHMDAILHELHAQRHFHDASCFYHVPELGEAVAVYDVPGPTAEQDAQVSVERRGERFELVPSVRADVGAMAECTYREFNPGGVDILSQLNGTNPERESQAGAYQRLLEAYQRNGQNDVPEAGEAREEAAPVPPDQAPGYDAMSPAEKLKAQADYLDAKAAHEQQIEDEDEMRPRLPGERRYGQ